MRSEHIGTYHQTVTAQSDAEGTTIESSPIRAFLCHSSGDKAAVRDLYLRLKADGFLPWLDDENLIAGQDWEHEIRKAVRHSDTVVVCLSRNSINKTGFIQKELKYALDVADEQPAGSIFIIPLRLEQCDVPERLAKWHWINYFEDDGHKRLVQALRAKGTAGGAQVASDTGVPAKATGAPPPSKTTNPDSPSGQPYGSLPQGAGGEAYKPALWERILASVCAVAVLMLVFVVVLRKTPLDQNQIVLIRIVLSLAVSIIGAVVPGFLQVSLSGKGVVIRAGGALALFVITFFFSPRVLPLNKDQLRKIEKSTVETQGQIGRIVTKFSSIFVQAVYDLPQTEPDVNLLKDSLAEISRKVREDKKQLPDGLQLSYSYPASDQNAPKEPIVSIDLDKILEEGFVQLSPKLVDLIPLVTFLKQPTLELAINQPPRDRLGLVDSFLGRGDPPDLRLYVHGWPVDSPKGNFGKIILDPRSNRVLVSWNGFDYPADQWVTSRKVQSIQDLDRAQLVVMLRSVGSVDPRIDKIAAGSLPVWVNVKFDNNFVTFVDLPRLPPVLQWQAFTATFPPEQSILDGKASHSLDPAYSWGF